MLIRIDEIDRRLLKILQGDGRRQNTDLANDVGLSPSPCLRRIKLLEEQGVIDRYVALLNPAALGMTVTVFVRVTLEKQDKATVDHFTREIQHAPQVLECHLMGGDCDFLLRVVASDLEDYQHFLLEHLTCIRGVRNVKTEIPLKTVKQTTEFPL
jgi:DNA-binding Lrp family transcriptional regulator